MNNIWLKSLFLALVAVGVVVPYLAFVPWIMEHELDIPLLIEQAGINRIAAFAWLDVLVSAAALLIAAYSRRFITLKQASVVTILTLVAGVSAGLPMLFYFVVADKNKT
jgi:hypothetical protein